MEELIRLSPSAVLTEFSFYDLMIQLGLALVLSLLVQGHYLRFGDTFANRSALRIVFPFVTLTTLLVISVVKSSLALSLGLVGALSIVRFRTPIKEPEELAYLFLSIAIGLGLGANQITLTVVTTLVILAAMALLRRSFDRTSPNTMHLSVSMTGEDRVPPQEINALLSEHIPHVDLQRYGKTRDLSEYVYVVQMSEMDQLYRVAEELGARYPGLRLNFIDAPRVPGL